jgi:hypothetical protein
MGRRSNAALPALNLQESALFPVFGDTRCARPAAPESERLFLDCTQGGVRGPRTCPGLFSFAPLGLGCGKAGLRLRGGWGGAATPPYLGIATRVAPLKAARTARARHPYRKARRESRPTG